MELSNHLDISRVLPLMTSRFGWLNPTEAGYTWVDSDNCKSTTQRYFNDDSIYPAITVQNIIDAQPNESLDDAGKNAYLKSFTKGVALNVLSDTLSVPQFSQGGFLFEKLDGVRPTYKSAQNKFAGIRFELTEDEYAIELIEAMLHFDKDVTIKLYLFNSFKGKVLTLNVSVKAYEQKVVPLSHVIKYHSKTAMGGDWFLCYDMSTLGDAKAIDIGSCVKDYAIFDAYTFVSDKTGDETFDMYSYARTTAMYGLNVHINSFKEITNTVIRNLHLLDNLYGLKMAEKVITLIYNSGRKNIKNRVSKENIQLYHWDLHNVTMRDNPKAPGIKKQIEREIRNVQKTIFKMKSMRSAYIK